MTQQLKLLSFAGLLIATCSVHGEAPTTGSDLVAKVENFLWESVATAHPDAQEIRLNVRPPDARLNLTNCQQPELALHGSERIRHRMLVRVTCSPSYAIHLSATIEVLQDVVVTSQALGRQRVLQAADLDLASVNILTNQRQYMTALDQVTGNILTRSVRGGTPLTTGMVKAPDLVTRGDSVVIVASRGDLIVRMPGIAMMTGGMDDQINVRNQSSDRVVKGWVKAKGEVHVPF